MAKRLSLEGRAMNQIERQLKEIEERNNKLKKRNSDIIDVYNSVDDVPKLVQALRRALKELESQNHNEVEEWGKLVLTTDDEVEQAFGDILAILDKEGA